MPKPNRKHEATQTDSHLCDAMPEKMRAHMTRVFALRYRIAELLDQEHESGAALMALAFAAVTRALEELDLIESGDAESKDAWRERYGRALGMFITMLSTATEAVAVERGHNVEAALVGGLAMSAGPLDLDDPCNAQVQDTFREIAEAARKANAA